MDKIISLFLVLTTFLGSVITWQRPVHEATYDCEIREVQRDMSKYRGIQSDVRMQGGVPTLFVNGEAYPSVAYMTYLEKYNAYEDFARAGYRFFSMPVLFAGRWISITDGLTPFKNGFFDKEGEPDFSPMDEAVERILAVCPDAYIFPRVNITMPLWWEQSHPEDVNLVDGVSKRESFYSETYRADAAEMLRQFVQYVQNSDYADHIVGYQIAGGNTEEWFHYDLNAGYCKNAEKGFENFLKTYYPDVPYKGLPDMNKLRNKSVHYFRDEYLTRFLEYASFAVADAITDFAHLVKEETGNNLVVGTFYGYSLEVTSPGHGTHALKTVLDSPNIDFICSPNSYIGVRSPECDWTEMYPADSVRLHGKMCFQECDIRTHLTKLLCERDPETDPMGLLNNSIWLGPDTKEQARNMVRKSFTRQLVKGNGLWWFDMWGGWYADADLMQDMALYKDLYRMSMEKDRGSVAEVAAFVDESAYKYMTDSALRNAAFEQRKALGMMGCTYDVYDVFDFEAVCERYKAVVFLSGTKTERMERAVSVCKKEHIPYIQSNALKSSFSVTELRAFCRSNGVQMLCDTGDIVYANESYIALYALSDGEKVLHLPEKKDVQALFGKGTFTDTDTLRFTAKKGETVLFSLG